MDSCTSVFQCAAQEVAAVPIWLKILLPILGALLPRLFPQVSEWLDKILAYVRLVKPTPTPEPDQTPGPAFNLRERLLEILRGLFAKRDAAVKANDTECEATCTNQIAVFTEMLKGL